VGRLHVLSARIIHETTKQKKSARQRARRAGRRVLCTVSRFIRLLWTPVQPTGHMDVGPANRSNPVRQHRIVAVAVLSTGKKSCFRNRRKTECYRRYASRSALQKPGVRPLRTTKTKDNLKARWHRGRRAASIGFQGDARTATDLDYEMQIAPHEQAMANDECQKGSLCHRQVD